jgi:hypothetical protein
MGGKAMAKFRNRILCTLPVVALMWSLQPAVAQAQFTQQGPKLVGTDAIGGQGQSQSVSLSGDGNTAIVGSGSVYVVQTGAAWVYTRTGGVWSQQAKLVGTDATGDLPVEQGTSVSLSGDGNTAIVGGPYDNSSVSPPFVSSVGAAWVFAKPVFAGTPGEANCHGQSVSALAQQFGGLDNAAAALGFPSVQALQGVIRAFCEG